MVGGAVSIDHGSLMRTLPNQFARRGLKPSSERGGQSQQLELPHSLCEIDRLRGTVVPSPCPARVQGEQNLGMWIFTEQFAPYAASGIVDRRAIPGKYLLPVMMSTRFAIGNMAPEFQVDFLVLVFQKFGHVIAGEA